MQRPQQGRFAENTKETPLMLLARRIREEQGAASVRDFLTAMLPFAAPGELRNAAEAFGIPFEGIEPPQRTREPKPEPSSRKPDPMSLLTLLMQLRGAGSGGDGDKNIPLSLLGELMRTK